MNANRLIEEWRQQGRILEVEGANTVLWRMGQGETVICVHGVPCVYRKLKPGRNDGEAHRGSSVNE